MPINFKIGCHGHSFLNAYGMKIALIMESTICINLLITNHIWWRKTGDDDCLMTTERHGLMLRLKIIASKHTGTIIYQLY